MVGLSILSGTLQAVKTKAIPCLVKSERCLPSLVPLSPSGITPSFLSLLHPLSFISNRDLYEASQNNFHGKYLSHNGVLSHCFGSRGAIFFS